MDWLKRHSDTPPDQNTLKSGERFNVRKILCEITIECRYGKQDDGTPFATIEQCFNHGMANKYVPSHQFFLSILDAGGYRGSMGAEAYAEYSAGGRIHCCALDWAVIYDLHPEPSIHKMLHTGHEELDIRNKAAIIDAAREHMIEEEAQG